MRNNQTKKWIKYYRNCLADGELLDIKTSEAENGKFFGSKSALDHINLSDLYLNFHKSSKGKKVKSSGDKEEEEKFPITIFIAPFSLNGEALHAKKNDNVKKVFPFWIPASINEKGDLLISEEDNKLPWFVRSVLEPVCIDSNYFPIISSIDVVDNVLDNFIFKYGSFDEYWNSSNDFFKKVTGFSFENYQIDGFVTQNQICIIPAKEVVTAQNILRVYDDLKNINNIPPLLSKLLSFHNSHHDQLPADAELFVKKGHYGQFNNQFPLSNSQRQSLLGFDQENNGNILAVNGPPGTGKTTLLQSIVANEMVKAAIIGNTPPKIVASSTNNQAITNILDSFGTTNDSLERWLPNLGSLGSYMISSDIKKQNEAIKKGYQILTRSNDNLDGHYFSELHSSDINELEKHYRDCFVNKNEGDKTVSIRQIVDLLKQQIIHSVNKIDTYLATIEKVIKAESEHFPLSRLPDFLSTIGHLTDNLNTLKKEKQKLLSFKEKYNQFISSNRLTVFFSFIPSIKESYKRKLSLFLVDSPSDQFTKLTSNYEVETALLQSFQTLDNQTSILATDIEKKKTIYDFLYKLKGEYDILIDELEIDWNSYLNRLKQKDRKQIENEHNKLPVFEKVNRILDVTLRYSAFINTVHYWEGLWLIKQRNEELRINKGLASRESVFERISYLTPLFISTFHTLPGFCSFFEKTLDKWVQKPIYNLFDLLIVDEAGQVSTEVAVASFSLAKKALVVGDIFQIEPIWNIAYEKIDKGNLQEAQLLKEYEFLQLKKWGVLCSSGSLMHLAQKASTYEVIQDIGGTLLTEHRRCVDELVAFSNHYVYKDMLRPMVGSSDGILYKDEKTEIFLPPLSYLNIRGFSEKLSGSTYNTIEAEAIAKWVVKYGNAILTFYNNGRNKDDRKGLKDCIAVVTPFSEQKFEIKSQFHKYKIDKDITVGTVHALQGAERPIVIFSPAYGINHNSNQLFFDNGFNMLNVALTRAKQHFIVMGNLSLFNPGNNQKPSGGLARYLFSDNINELSTSFLYDDIQIQSANRVDSLEKHQQCLKRAFGVAKNRIIIVSPFISIHAIIADDLLQEIPKAISNNIEITVYTDKFLDFKNGKLKKSSEDGRKALIDAGATIKILKGIHNKAVAIDEEVLIEGSFNWLSAIRDKQHPHFRHEVSQIIKGQEAKIQIGLLLKELSSIGN